MSFYDIGAGIRQILLADEVIKNIVSSRVYSDHVPQSIGLPAIIYFVVAGAPEDTIDCRNIGYANTTIQIEAWTDPKSGGRPAANRLWYEINRVLVGYRGGNIRSIGQSSTMYSLEDRTGAGTDEYRFRAIQDFSVSYHFAESV